MKEEANIKKVTSTVSIKNKIDAETSKIKSEEKQIIAETTLKEKELVYKRLEVKRSLQSGKTFGTLFKMMMLSQIMSTTYSQDSNLPGNRLFTDDDLIDYKAKMKELLKQL